MIERCRRSVLFRQSDAYSPVPAAQSSIVNANERRPVQKFLAGRIWIHKCRSDGAGFIVSFHQTAAKLGWFNADGLAAMQIITDDRINGFLDVCVRGEFRVFDNVKDGFVNAGTYGFQYGAYLRDCFS